MGHRTNVRDRKCLRFVRFEVYTPPDLGYSQLRTSGSQKLCCASRREAAAHSRSIKTRVMRASSGLLTPCSSARAHSPSTSSTRSITELLVAR